MLSILICLLTGGGGDPVLDGGGGTPSSLDRGGAPILILDGVPPPISRMGVPPIQTWDRSTPPIWAWDGAPPTPSRPGSGPDGGTPPHQPDGVSSPLRQGVDWHTKWKYYLPHPSDAGGNNQVFLNACCTIIFSWNISVIRFWFETTRMHFICIFFRLQITGSIRSAWHCWNNCLKPSSLYYFVNKKAWLFLTAKWPLNFKEKSSRALPHGQIRYKMKWFQQREKKHTQNKWKWITPNNKHVFVSVSVWQWFHVTSSHKRQRSDAFRSARPKTFCHYFNAISHWPMLHAIALEN